ncbi:MAG: helix-turn-helix transcriptional regulator [Tyzzerella sp.]|nr:helix-turn-helix transcriptional regulator [Tyzzerella sp.]
MSYIGTTLEDIIRIDELFTIHYFEYTSEFLFTGESHDFWEFVCVDKGSVKICMDETELTLHKGEIAFHQPNEFHNVSTYSQVAPNLVVVSFKCDSPFMDFFKQKVLKIDEKERSLLAKILVEAQNLFETSLNNPYTKEMKKKHNTPIGSEQLIRMYLESFLLNLIRRYSSSEQEIPLPVTKSSTDIFNRVSDYMEDNLSTRLSIQTICRDNMIGRTQLQNVFQKEAGMGVIEYFSKMKIQNAKHMIRMGSLNFTQISEQLGYTSIHYFSRQFKKLTGMTPSEYASSVKAMMDKNA